MAYLPKLFIGLISIAAISAVALTANADTIRTVRTSLDEDNCTHVSGDYGDPLVSAEVKSVCEGAEGWTIRLTNLASHQKIAFRYEDTSPSDNMNVFWFGRRGAFSDPEWIYRNDSLIGAVISYREFEAGPDLNDQAFNVYAIVLRPEQEISACIAGRVEAMKKRGADSAAEDLLKYFADSFVCGTSDPLSFTAESTGGISFQQAVRQAAIDAGVISSPW